LDDEALPFDQMGVVSYTLIAEATQLATPPGSSTPTSTPLIMQESHRPVALIKTTKNHDAYALKLV